MIATSSVVSRSVVMRQLLQRAEPRVRGRREARAQQRRVLRRHRLHVRVGAQRSFSIGIPSVPMIISSSVSGTRAATPFSASANAVMHPLLDGGEQRLEARDRPLERAAPGGPLVRTAAGRRAGARGLDRAARRALSFAGSCSSSWR